MHSCYKVAVMFIFMSIGTSLFAQFEGNNWFFGDSAAISFNNDMVTTVYTSAMHSSEGCASISDPCGNLLFYTNGEEMYNRAHQVMPNGTKGSFSGHQSSTQSALIVPKPGSPDIYYVFTNDARERELLNGLRYSIVDMTLDGGLGDVIDEEKNTLLLLPSSEKLTAVKHSNGVDVWVVAHRYYSNQFYSFLVTQNGIQTPVITAVGSLHQDIGANFNANAVGAMKLSPDGTKIALTLFEEDRAELFDFNSTTGIVSNAVKLPINKSKVFGVGWSPNSKVLYIGSEFEIDQFDVTATNVFASKRTVFSEIDRQIRGLQVAYDGKLYISRFNNGRLDRINLPNLLGDACDVEIDIPNPLAPGGTRACLPNFIQSYFDENAKPKIIASGYCTNNVIDFKLNSYVDVDSVKWNFGDPASGFDNNSVLNEPQHIFQSDGEYFITLRVYKNCPQPIVVRAILEMATRPEIELGNDTAICLGDALTLGKLDNTVEFSWSTGDEVGEITVSDSGLYIVELRNVCDTIADTIHITYKYVPKVNIAGDTEMCVNASQELASVDSFVIDRQWSTAPGDIDSMVTIFTPGKYWVDVSNECGAANDTIEINPVELPTATLPPDTTICRAFSFDIGVETENAQYQWSTGDTTQSITVTEGGIYFVNVTKCGITVRDEMTILRWETIENFTPNAFTPNGDLLNDTFAPVISFILYDSAYRFMIFDRWGTKMVDTDDPTFSWNGTYDGKPAQQGMYMYIVEFRGCNGKKTMRDGSFLLIR